MQRLTFVDELRDDPRWPGVGIDDLLVKRLHDAIAGHANDAELGALVGRPDRTLPGRWQSGRRTGQR